MFPLSSLPTPSFVPLWPLENEELLSAAIMLMIFLAYAVEKCKGQPQCIAGWFAAFVPLFRLFSCKKSNSKNGKCSANTDKSGRGLEQEQRQQEDQDQNHRDCRTKRTTTTRTTTTTTTLVHCPVDKANNTGMIQIMENGKSCLNFSSYNYAGMARFSQQIETMAQERVQSFGTNSCHGSRSFFAHRLGLELEQRIAAFFHKETAMVATSGYLANIMAIRGLVSSERDFCVHDKEIHMSVYDGMKLSGASMRSFDHGNLEQARHILSQIRGSNKKRRILILSEGVHSKRGTIVNLPQLRELADEFQALVVLDESHSIGAVGRQGRGVQDHFDMPTGADVIIGSLSKGISGQCGFAAFRAGLLAPQSSSMSSPSSVLCCTNSISPFHAAWSSAALHLFEQHAVATMSRLAANIRHLRVALHRAGFEEVDENAATPVIPIHLPLDCASAPVTGSTTAFDKPTQLFQSLLDQGFYNSFLQGASGAVIRICVQHWMTPTDMDNFANVLAACYHKVYRPPNSRC